MGRGASKSQKVLLHPEDPPNGERNALSSSREDHGPDFEPSGFAVHNRGVTADGLLFDRMNTVEEVGVGLALEHEQAPGHARHRAVLHCTAFTRRLGLRVTVAELPREV